MAAAKWIQFSRAIATYVAIAKINYIDQLATHANVIKL